MAKDKILNIKWLKETSPLPEMNEPPYINYGIEDRLADPDRCYFWEYIVSSEESSFSDLGWSNVNPHVYIQLGGISDKINSQAVDDDLCWFRVENQQSLQEMLDNIGDDPLISGDPNVQIYILSSFKNNFVQTNLQSLNPWTGSSINNIIKAIKNNLFYNNGLSIINKTSTSASFLVFNSGYDLVNDFDVSVDLSNVSENAELLAKILNNTYCPTKQEILDITNNGDNIVTTPIIIDATTIKEGALSNKYLVLSRQTNYPWYALAESHTTHGGQLYYTPVSSSDTYIVNALGNNLYGNSNSNILGASIVPGQDNPPGPDPDPVQPSRVIAYEIYLVPLDADYITKMYYNSIRDVYEYTYTDNGNTAGYQYWSNNSQSQTGWNMIIASETTISPEMITNQFQYWFDISTIKDFYKDWILNRFYGTLAEETSITPITAWNPDVSNWLNPDADYVIDEGVTANSNNTWNTSNYTEERIYANNQLVKEKDIIPKPSGEAPPPAQNVTIENKSFIIEYIVNSIFIAATNTAVVGSHWDNTTLTIPTSTPGSSTTISIQEDSTYYPRDIFTYSGGNSGNYTIGRISEINNEKCKLVRDGGATLWWRPNGPNQQWTMLNNDRYPTNPTMLYDLKFRQPMKLSGYAGDYSINDVGINLSVIIESNGSSDTYTDFNVYFNVAGQTNLNKVNIVQSTNVPIYLTADINIQSGEGSGNSGSGGGVATTEPSLSLLVGGEDRWPYWDCEVENDCGYFEGIGTVINVGYTESVTLQLGNEWYNAQGLKIKFMNTQNPNLSYTWRFEDDKKIRIALGSNSPSSSGYTINKNTQYNIHLLDIDPSESYVWSLGELGEDIPYENMTLCSFEILYSIDDGSKDDGSNWKSFQNKKIIKWIYPGHHIPH